MMQETIKTKMVGRVFNIQRYSTHDGPGIRTTVFLKGCPLRCFWCQNPESQPTEPTLMYQEKRCTLCGRCIHVCPNGVNELRDGKLILNRERCTGCGACIDICLAKARSLEGRLMCVEQVMDEVRKDRLLYRNSGGGMTVSGGACEMQPDFTAALLQAAHREGISTAVEMEGAFGWNVIWSIAQYADYILYDLKCMDDQRHRAGTRVSNKMILQNARDLVRAGCTIRFRMPLIPEFNDDPESVRKVAQFVKEELGLDPVQHLELLSYNNLGEEKYIRMAYPGQHPHYARQSEEYLASLRVICDNI